MQASGVASLTLKVVVVPFAVHVQLLSPWLVSEQYMLYRSPLKHWKSRVHWLASPEFSVTVSAQKLAGSLAPLVAMAQLW